MLSRLAKVLALVAAVQILGGHWMALQSVAWMGMVIDYAKETSSLSAAIEKTFDGAHPCQLCETVTKGRSEEQKNESMKLVLKFEAVLATPLAMPAPRGEPWTFSPWVESHTTRAHSPPTPPPPA